VTVKNWLSALAVVICLFLGFWAFAYQGYTEDAGSRPLNTWRYGVAFYTAAAVLLFTMIRRRWSHLSGGHLILLALGLALAGTLAALLSLDAGGGSFEF
jgi:hypothetical protein